MGNKTTRTGYYSKDNPPAIQYAPPRRMVAGLAPWLQQASAGSAPPPAPGGSMGGNWWAGQAADTAARNAAAYEQYQAQLRQAELLRAQQQASTGMPAGGDPNKWSQAQAEAASIVKEDPTANEAELTAAIFRNLSAPTDSGD